MKVKGVRDQFKEELAFGGVLSFIKEYGDLLRPMFVDEAPALSLLVCKLCMQLCKHSSFV